MTLWRIIDTGTQLATIRVSLKGFKNKKFN